MAGRAGVHNTSPVPSFSPSPVVGHQPVSMGQVGGRHRHPTPSPTFSSRHGRLADCLMVQLNAGRGAPVAPTPRPLAEGRRIPTSSSLSLRPLVIPSLVSSSVSPTVMPSTRSSRRLPGTVPSFLPPSPCSSVWGHIAVITRQPVSTQQNAMGKQDGRQDGQRKASGERTVVFTPWRYGLHVSGRRGTSFCPSLSGAPRPPLRRTGRSRPL